MRDYEVVIIVSPAVEEERVGSVVDRVSAWITGRAGTIDKVEPWGRRKLAYTINDFREGTYFLLRAKMDPASVDELENNLRISEDVIRHMVIRSDG
ncbi:MAG: 30S ribosomal protein S6 [Dehalococcoidia bacterium]|nr:30S ribosomal protein S6 [Dehalococcoidia bacterium]